MAAVWRKRWTVTRCCFNEGHVREAVTRCLFSRYCTPWTVSRSPLALGEEHVVDAARRLPQPSLENGTGGFCQRRTALLAALSDDAQVSAASRDEVLSLEPGHLRQPKPGLHRGEDEGVVAPSRPRVSIRCRKQRIDLRAAEKADQLARESLARDGEHSLDLRCMGRQLERRVAEEGMDRGQSQIAASNAHAAAGLELIEERGDQRCVDLLERQARGRPSEALLAQSSGTVGRCRDRR